MSALIRMTKRMTKPLYFQFSQNFFRCLTLSSSKITLNEPGDRLYAGAHHFTRMARLLVSGLLWEAQFDAAVYSPEGAAWPSRAEPRRFLTPWPRCKQPGSPWLRWLRTRSCSSRQLQRQSGIRHQRDHLETVLWCWTPPKIAMAQCFRFQVWRERALAHGAQKTYCTWQRNEIIRMFLISVTASPHFLPSQPTKEPRKEETSKRDFLFYYLCNYANYYYWQ